MRSRGTTGQRSKKNEQKLQEVNDSLAQLESSIRQQNIHITDTFGPYLGKEYLNTDKLLGLSKLIQSGTASNITEAIEMDKNGVEKQKQIKITDRRERQNKQTM